MEKQRRYLIIFLILLVAFFSFWQCVKEDKAGSFSTTDESFTGGRSPSSIQGVLPVNLGRYNLNRQAQTKSTSGADTAFFMCLDSLVDFNKVKQVYFEGSKWLYCQYSLKSNETGIYGAVVAGQTNFRDSLVQIKCYYLQVGNIELSRLSEYVVTMIPTKVYSGVNPGFDFLEKPAFSGVILYSSIHGDLLRSEFLEDGIIRRCFLKEHLSPQFSGTQTKGANGICHCGAQTLEDDGVCIACKELELNPIVVIADNIDWENYIRMILNGLNETELDYITDDDGGSGGIHDGRCGGGIEDADTKVLVTCRASGCNNALLTIVPVTKGSSFSYTAPLRSENSTCWFKNGVRRHRRTFA